MFNIKKYRSKRFHKDIAINKKIEALFLLYDKRVHDGNFNYIERTKLLNVFMINLIKHEEYEIVQAFKERKWRKWKKWRRERRGRISSTLLLRLIRFKIRNLFMKKNNNI